MAERCWMEGIGGFISPDLNTLREGDEVKLERFEIECAEPFSSVEYECPKGCGGGTARVCSKHLPMLDGIKPRCLNCRTRRADPTVELTFTLPDPA